jgi:hypothetical protein
VRSSDAERKEAGTLFVFGFLSFVVLFYFISYLPLPPYFRVTYIKVSLFGA